MMGQELLPTGSGDAEKEEDDGDDGFFDRVGDKASDLKDDVIDYGNDLLGDGRMTEALGIADRYSKPTLSLPHWARCPCSSPVF